MAVQGIIPPRFSPKSHELGVLNSAWRDFISELDIYFLASGQSNTPDKQKIALLLYQMGKQYQKVFSNDLVFDRAEDKDDFEKVCEKFKLFFEPRKLTKSYITKFQQRHQEPSESVNEFITALRELAKLCDFGAKENDMLCVQISNGVRDEVLKKKLWDSGKWKSARLTS